MKTFKVTIIKTNNVKVGVLCDTSNETVAYRKTIKHWGKELKSVWNIEEIN